LQPFLEHSGDFGTETGKKKQWEFSNKRRKRKAAKIDNYLRERKVLLGDARAGGLLVFLFTTGASG
jgi:hypothetical protein